MVGLFILLFISCVDRSAMSFLICMCIHLCSSTVQAFWKHKLLRWSHQKCAYEKCATFVMNVIAGNGK